MAASITWANMDWDATPAYHFVAGDYVKHWDTKRVGLAKYVGVEKMVIFFGDENVEQWRWLTAFEPSTIGEYRIWVQQYRMRNAAAEQLGA